MNNAYVVGIDFGTDSVRALIVDAQTGEEVATAVHQFSRWKSGQYCNSEKNQFRQHPRDHIEGLEITLKESLKKAPKKTAESIKGISFDTTGSTPCAVSKEGVPLSLLPQFQNDPDAMFIMWKDHTAVEEAEAINHTARSWGGTDFTIYSGGIYSSEWFWAKMLHVLRHNTRIRNTAFSWVEHCDWLPALLTGKTDPLTMKRSRCAAGHKAMWHESFEGLPSEDFLVAVDPLLSGIRSHLYKDTYTANISVGSLSSEWAKRLGLPVGIPVGIGAFDAHMGAVGGTIKPYVLSKVIGTSTCDMIVASKDDIGNKCVRGICGQVDGSIVPGMIGMEAGQSAFGDIYAWFRDVLSWPLTTIHKGALKNCERIIPELSREAEKVPVDDTGIVALDWMNGRRTPDANQLLKGAITGLALGSTAPAIFRALVEATAFGSRKIIDRFESEGIRIDEVIALGGVAKKSPFVMQVLADILGRTIKVAKSEQTCALGAAMFASVLGGIYPTVEKAMDVMGSGFEMEHHPKLEHKNRYNRLYERYSHLGDFVERETMRVR